VRMFDFYDAKLKRLCFFVDVGEYICYEVRPPKFFFRPWWEIVSPSGEVQKFPKRLSLFEVSNILSIKIERSVFSVFLPKERDKQCNFFVVGSLKKGLFLFFFKDNPLPQKVFSIVKVSDRPCLSKLCVEEVLGEKYPCIKKGLARVW